MKRMAVAKLCFVAILRGSALRAEHLRVTVEGMSLAADVPFASRDYFVATGAAGGGGSSISA